MCFTMVNTLYKGIFLLINSLADPNIKFPSHYPTSSLLGCVHVDSCLPQEEYRDTYPNGESDSPYVFVCSKPEQLNLLLPVQGDHKICKDFALFS